jgi:hypothetical protein
MALLLRWSAVLVAFSAAAPAHAYLGPGVGLGAIGTALGVIGSIVLGLFTVVWYPLKRLIRKLQRRARDADTGD